MAAMMLGDMGANVIRIDRLRSSTDFGVEPKYAIHGRNRRSIAINLRDPAATAIVLRLIETADALIEPFRPGVAERLGVGPDACFARNKKLVYGRITGWGQDGPLAKRAGHDINYIALTGILHAMGRHGDKPVPPLNLVADYGGGGMLLAFGILCGLLETMKSGLGQVVDAAMIDGSSLLFGLIAGLQGAGLWRDARGTNLLDSGAHFYEVYETKDGKYVAVGAIEPEFYTLLIEKLGLASEPLPHQMDRDSWPSMKDRFAAVFKTRTRDEWCNLMEAADACLTPVLAPGEAASHPHARARKAFVDIDGATHPSPAPRFSRTQPAMPVVAPQRGADTDAILTEASFSKDEIERFRRSGVIA
jgi:alpha-methylacyl-CoA racemase